MEMRELGRSGLRVCPLMLGGNVFGWTADERTSFAVLDAYVEAGGNFIDTADVYSRWAPGHQGGESEEILGRWLRQSGKRDHVVLATKVGNDMGEGRKGLAKQWIKQAAEDSLRRLGVERIDLYQAHRDDPATPLEETLEAFGELIAEGKVRAIGASNYSGARLEESLRLSEGGLPRFESLQPQYNLMERKEFEGELLPVVERWGLGCVPYYALAAGFLTGKYRSAADVEGKARAGVVGRYANERGFGVVRVLAEVAHEHGANPAQVALAWLMAKPGVTAPIASATSLEQLSDLMRACLLRLSPEAVARLDAASA
jgi:aryl-alcohol dehydrogenase-like predicted oxidoreductase